MTKPLTTAILCASWQECHGHEKQMPKAPIWRHEKQLPQTSEKLEQNMALTVKFLKGMGIDEEKIESIIEAHKETIDGLKAARDKALESAAEAEGLKAKLTEAEAKIAEAQGEDGWQAKYESEHQAFEDYKSQVESEKAEADKANQYRKLLADAGVDPKRIDLLMRVTDLSKVELEDGKLKDVETLTEGIRHEWADFITTVQKKGDKVETPPQTQSETSFEKMSLAEKMSYANEHPADADVRAWLAK